MNLEYQKAIVSATPVSPCPHCEKPDWCYRLGDLSVCNRDIEPSPGWYKTSKTDKDGHYFYAPTDSKPKAKSQTRYWIYQDVTNHNIARVVRIDKGDGTKPTRYQEHWDGKSWIRGLKGIDRADIPVYRYAEVRKAIEANQTIYIVEGEYCADAMWSIGLPATTNIAGCKQWKPSDAECLDGAVEVVICPDRDLPGINYGLKVSEDFPDALWLYAPPSQFFWLKEHLPDSQGLDVADWIASGATKKCITSQITNLSPGKFSESLPLYSKPTEAEQAQKTREVIIEAEEIYTQKAVDCLFSDCHYIAIHDRLYKYSGTHYELCSSVRERKRIIEWCKTTPQKVGSKWKYSLATPEAVNKIWAWVLSEFSVEGENVNPPGINCLNGVVKISWKGRKVSYELVDHDPSFYYTHVSNFEYDSEADDTDCNRLLAALEPEQQQIFLRTIAASLDLNSIRKYQGRAVKALLCKGSGSNGKDTLREAVRCILGAGMTGASVTDFQQYDQGRKFPIAKIEHSQINWSSENSHFARLDSLQGLKAAITGETIDIEAKNSKEYSITPRSVFLFNVNEAPLLDGGTEAIESRWAVLEFNKTFKKNACEARGELEADSRFRYDPEFLDNNVCPALLNKILQQLQAVILEGINYSCCDGALKELQEQSNHLWQFVNDVGVVESPGDRLYISDLWQSLLEWYKDTGTLEIVDYGDRQKKVWNDQPRKSDRNITASNQVSRRFKELFPHAEIKRHTENDGSNRKGQAYLLGMAIANNPDGGIWANRETLTALVGEDGEAKIAELARLIAEIKHLSEAQKLAATNIMNQFTTSEAEVVNSSSPSSPPTPVDVSASPLASPSDRQRSPVTYTQENNDCSNHATESNLFLTINNAANSPEYKNENSSTNSVDIDKHIVDWVRDREGVSWNITDRDGHKLTGHRPGLRGDRKIDLNNCAEVHYKRSPVEAEI